MECRSSLAAQASRQKSRRWVLAPVLLCVALAAGDTVVLKNGNRVEGRITAESAEKVSINTGAVELVVPSDTVLRVEKGLSLAFEKTRADKVLKQAKELMAAGRREDARLLLEATLRELDIDEQAATDAVPPELATIRRGLDAARRAALPPDPDSQHAEELYASALEKLDKVKHGDALKDLLEAHALAPGRADIALKMAETAVRVNDPDSAIKGYRAVLSIDPETYYKDASQPLMEILQTRGRRLLADRRADEAVEVYSTLLLLQGGDATNPLPLEQFMVRRAERARLPEDQVLMEVYRYADSNDLVDLAFAAASKATTLKPAVAEYKKLADESGFLVRFRDRIASGDAEGAGKLQSEAPPDLLTKPGMKERLERLAGEAGEEVRAQELLQRAETNLQAGDFEGAATIARQIMVDYAASKAAPKATAILRECEVEAPLKAGIEEARHRLETADDAGAEKLLKGLQQNPGYATSKLKSEVEKLLAHIPTEKLAEEQWELARADLDGDHFQEALDRLDSLVAKYGDTRAGRRAGSWLNEYRTRLARQATSYHPVGNDYFVSVLDPNAWRAAATAETAPKPLKVPPVEDAGRKVAWQLFNQVHEADAAGRVDRRPQWLLVGVPILAGGLLLLGLLWRYARPGHGKLHGTSTAGSQSGCRLCGQALPPEAPLCKACGATQKQTDIEAVRGEDHDRRAGYDPWDIRVKAQELNKFDTFFGKARDLAETSDVEAAITNCRLALQEDPHRVAGYKLLAGLYERVGRRDEAAICYREILLLDPGEAIVRDKIESVLSLSEKPLLLGRVPLVLSSCAWWLGFFVLVGLEPSAPALRAALCVPGAWLTALLWTRIQARSRRRLPAVAHGAAEFDEPLPATDLTWREQGRQARVLAKLISEHTHYQLPALESWRLLAAIGLSMLLLLVLVGIAWQNHAPWVVAGWPGGALLLVYWLEIHPRVLTAYVLLRHFYEETISPWADPHRPFRPQGAGKGLAGEFLVTSLGELPLRWALRPLPYSSTRQGVLNSLQQTLNRHWACHRFYEELRVVREVDIPVPVGFRLAGVAAVVLLLAGLAGGIAAEVGRRQAATRYEEAVKIGYQYLLEGDLGEAQRYLQQGIRLDASRILPWLYLGHVRATAGMVAGAESAFREAAKRDHGVPACHNDFANFLQRQGRLREAIAEYQVALREGPENPDVLNNLGSAHYKLKEFEEAVKYLERAVKAEPRHERAWTTLGLVCEELGRGDRARQAYETAVKVAPDLPYTRVAKDRLAADLAREDKEPLRLQTTEAKPVGK